MLPASAHSLEVNKDIVVSPLAIQSLRPRGAIIGGS
jgi:hypothetical protein